MTVAIDDAFGLLPEQLRKDLLDAFNDIVKNYRERRWEPSELKGGKLCEAVYSVIFGYLDGGQYPERAKKPNRFVDSCHALEAKFQQVPNSHSARVLIARMMVGLYDIRNNRGVGHVGGDVDPNHMDATAVLYMSKWLMSELVRLLHDLDTEAASELVEMLTEREFAWVWTDGDVKRLLRTDLTWKQQTLLMLLTESAPTAETDLVRWLEHPSAGVYRRDVLRPLHKARRIEYSPANKTARLLPPGVVDAEVLIQERR